MRTFSIKDGYRTNPPYIYNTENADISSYWTKDRLIRSTKENYYVYEYAYHIAQKHNLKSLIDLGCGVGIKLKHFFEHSTIEITGIDSESTAKYCGRTYSFGRFYGCNLSNPELNNLPEIQNKTFDLILCSDVIEHLDDPDLLLEFIKKISHSQTQIILSTPERDYTRGRKNNYSVNKFHVREWNCFEFRSYIENSGFKILNHVTVPPIKPYISLFFFKSLLYSLIFFRPFVLKGTQIIHFKL